MSHQFITDAIHVMCACRSSAGGMGWAARQAGPTMGWPGLNRGGAEGGSHTSQLPRLSGPCSSCRMRQGTWLPGVPDYIAGPDCSSAAAAGVGGSPGPPCGVDWPTSRLK